MKKKQNKDNSKSSRKESDDNSLEKYSNEEITSAMTLASIMANESFDPTEARLIDVVNENDTSGDDSKSSSSGLNETIDGELPNSVSQKPTQSPPKTTSNETNQNQSVVELESKQTLHSCPMPTTGSTQPPMNGNPSNYGNYYGYGYQMDPYSYYPVYPMYSMPQLSAPPMSSRQCPYCSMTSPPMASLPTHPQYAMSSTQMTSLPTHSQFPMAYNMFGEPQKKMSELAVNSFAVSQPQVMANQIPIGSLYPYYQNGPKVTSACVQSTEAQKN